MLVQSIRDECDNCLGLGKWQEFLRELIDVNSFFLLNTWLPYHLTSHASSFWGNYVCSSADRLFCTHAQDHWSIAPAVIKVAHQTFSSLCSCMQCWWNISHGCLEFGSHLWRKDCCLEYILMRLLCSSVICICVRESVLACDIKCNYYKAVYACVSSMYWFAQRCKLLRSVDVGNVGNPVTRGHLDEYEWSYLSFSLH